MSNSFKVHIVALAIAHLLNTFKKNLRNCKYQKINDFLFLGVAIKSTLDNTSTVQYAGLMGQLADKARSVVRDLDPSNDLTFLRIRSKKHEIMIAPDKDFIMIVIQNPTD